MQDWLAARVVASPDALALVVGEVRLTYYELDEWVRRACGYLREVGVVRGEHVAVLMTNSADYVVLVHALARMGAVLVPLNTRLTVEEMRWQVAHVEADVLLYGDDRAAVADAVDVAMKGRFALSDLSDAALLDDTIAHDWHDAVQAIVFTSGTSGAPKGVQITYANHFNSAMASAYRLGLTVDDRWLSVLPLFHVGGLAVLFRSVLYGTAVILKARFDVDDIAATMGRDAVTMISLVPTMLYRMMAAGVTFPQSVRLILLGGAAATPQLMADALRAGLPVALTYGLTEATSQVATATPAQTRAKPTSVGKPLLFTQVRVVDESGVDVPPNMHGAILVKGPTVMRGYWRNPDATAQTVQGSWLHTGDIGLLDEDGDLHITQRRSDLIVSGGENVYPSEVEHVLLASEDVAAVCVVGVDDAEWGQRVVAAIVPTRKDIDIQQLMNYSRSHLAGYKQPRRIILLDSLPQTASGKVSRADVRRVVMRLMQGKN